MEVGADEKARGVRLRAARELKGLSQEELAAQLQVSRVTVSGWENGAEISEDRMPELELVLGG